jgi:hypothetical protein
MNTDFSPQFSLDELYISPFSAKRYYDLDTCQAHYRPVERNLAPTGVKLMDRFLQLTCTSKSYSAHLMAQ